MITPVIAQSDYANATRDAWGSALVVQGFYGIGCVFPGVYAKTFLLV